MDLGSFRDVLLLLDLTVIVLVGQIAFLFLLQYLQKKDNKVPLLFGITFSIVCLALIFRFVSVYYSGDPIFNQFYYVGLALTIFAFSLSVEWQFGTILKTKRVVTVFTGALVAPIALIPWQSPIFNDFFMTVEMTYLFPFYFIAFIYLKNRGLVRKKMVIAFFGFLLIMAGVGGSTDVFQAVLLAMGPLSLFGTYMILFKVLMIAGLGLFYFAFNSNIFLETNWRSQLLELYIIHAETSAQLYYQNFQVTGATQEEGQSLFSSGIAGITGLVKEFTRSDKDIRIIDQGSIKIIMERGQTAIAAFVARENLKILRYFLREIMKEFEVYFGSITQPEQQDAKFFSSMRSITNMILSQV